MTDIEPVALSVSGITARYTLSSATVYRLIKRGMWPKGLPVLAGRKVWDPAECDRAFRALLNRKKAAHTLTPKERQRELARKRKREEERQARTARIASERDRATPPEAA